MSSLPAWHLGWHGMKTPRGGCAQPAKKRFPACFRRGTMLRAPTSPRLVIVARPQSGMVELEFVATTRQENIEDQLAFLTNEAAVPTPDDFSLRLLRHHASAVRHQKFHGVDIVTVQVEGNA